MEVLELDLAEYLNLPVNTVIDKAKSANADLKERWQEHHGGAEGFYRGNGMYLYDLLAFNANPNWLPRIIPVLKSDCRKHLDIGCGIGTLCLLRAFQGHDSTGYDINERVLDFARWRANKYGFKVTFTSELPDFSQYDLITAIDTLEHIEDLGGFLKQVGESVKPNTLLYHFDTFGSQENSPMHFDHSRKIQKWLAEAGFEVITREWAIKSNPPADKAAPKREKERGE